ncbi:DUF6538 domain-containing protein [Massilia terrae]|uniref:DUF6538 domain-containing protein n=1 Tax=Massilia terrae TaxID=1811224 RepID=UPI00351D2DC9
MAGNFLVRSRHGTVYYFCRRVPLHLQSIIGRKVLVQSLQTSDRRSAIIRSRAVAVHTDSIFQEIMARKKRTHPITLFTSSLKCRCMR